MSNKAPACFASKTKKKFTQASQESITSIVKNLKREKPKFTILVGSCARRTPKRYSDIDIVRVGHTSPVRLESRHIPKQKFVSYIDYNLRTFARLYELGSLFLLHVFMEGELIKGNAKTWQRLKRNFRVNTDFRKEIAENREVLKWLQRGRKFHGASYPYLAHTFRALKNLAIFSLAQKNRYVFDKRLALKRAFPNLDSDVITILMTAGDIFERSRSNQRFARKLRHNVLPRVKEEVANAINRFQVHANS